jgi:hypothetical protein
MREIIAQDSDPDAIARRARDAAQAAANAAPKEQMSNPGMPSGGGGGGPGRPDYSDAIDRAIATLEKPAASGSFDRMIGQKKERAAAAQILSATGGMQTSGDQMASQQSIAGMNNATDRAKANQAAAIDRQRIEQTGALGNREMDVREGQNLITAQNYGMQRQVDQEKMQLAKEQADINNQIEADRLGISRKELELKNATFDRENQLANQKAQEGATDQAIRTDVLRNQRRGMFGGISPEDELMAQAGGRGAVPLDYFLKKQK